MTLAVNASGAGQVQARIYNLTGECVATFKAPAANPGTATLLSWNCGSVAPGIYLLRITQDNQEIGKTKVAVVR
jgi:hypothetical protein